MKTIWRCKKYEYEEFKSRWRGRVTATVAAVAAVALAAALFSWTEWRRDALEEPTSWLYLPLVMRDRVPLDSRKGMGLDSDRCEMVYMTGSGSVRTWWPHVKYCPSTVGYPCVCTLDLVATALDVGIQGYNTDFVLTLNEPVVSRIDPTEAAHAFRELVVAFPDKKFACPGIVRFPQGVDWLHEFINAYGAAYGSMPCQALDWHCYGGSASACIDQSEEMIALADSWGVEMMFISEIGLVDDAEFASFLDWLQSSEVDAWFAFVSESPYWPQFSLSRWDSDPVELTSRGETYRDNGE